VPKLGWVKFHLYREIRGKVLNVSLKREAKGWFLYAQCYTGEAPEKVPVRTMVGIDVGLNLLAVTSDGKTIENPRFFRRSEDELARRQKSWKRKRSGSASCRRASNLVSKTREHIANQRLDHARKVAKQLVEQYDLIAYESLTIANMARWGNLGKSVNDAGWAILLKAIASKAEEAGKHAVAVVSRGTSLNCSGCGQRVDKDLSVRVHSCPCGLVIDRDLNAARNVLALGRSAVVVS
jgi:putative transposase